MLFVIVGTLMILTNLAGVGPLAAWNWEVSGDLWKFCLPFGLAAIWWLWSDKSGLNRRREMAKMERRKQNRRKENLAALGMGTEGRKGTRR